METMPFPKRSESGAPERCWRWLAAGVLLESARREVERRGRGVLNPLISFSAELPAG